MNSDERTYFKPWQMPDNRLYENTEIKVHRRKGKQLFIANVNWTFKI